MSIRRWPSTSGSAAARPATSAASGSDPVSTSVLNSPRTYRQPRPVTASDASALDSLVCSMPPIVPALPLRGERDPAEHLGEPGRLRRPEALPGRRAGRGQRVGDLHQLVRVRALVPPPLTVEVTAQIVAVPSRFTRPVTSRSPSVAGAQG